MTFKKLMPEHYYCKEIPAVTIKKVGDDWKIFDTKTMVSMHMVGTAKTLVLAKIKAEKYIKETYKSTF